MFLLRVMCRTAMINQKNPWVGEPPPFARILIKTALSFAAWACKTAGSYGFGAKPNGLWRDRSPQALTYEFTSKGTKEPPINYRVRTAIPKGQAITYAIGIEFGL